MAHDAFRGSIGALAAAAGVNVETIRFYQRKGLLAQPARRHAGVRQYTGADLGRVRFVKAAQRLGFSLTDIAALLALDDGAHCDEARLLAEHKLDDVREQVRDLRRMESALRRAVSTCRAARGTIRCPLIGSLQTGLSDPGPNSVPGRQSRGDAR